MNCHPKQPMRKLILTGTYAQYRDWLALHNANPRAAVYIHREEQFLGCDPEYDDIVLGDCHRDNPAFQSKAYLWFTAQQGIRLAS